MTELLLLLFFNFFRIGLFAIGGGLATLPFLYELSADTGWFTVQDISNMVAISESTPGPMGVNMATYVGNIISGPLGGLIATLGLICPSIIIIILISKILDKFRSSKLVDHIFYGLRPASTALITAAGIGVAELAFLKPDVFEVTGSVIDLISWPCLIMAVIWWFALKKWNLHPIVYIIAAGVVGYLLKL